MVAIDIEGNVAKYLGARSPTGRYASFDYCFNYFRSHYEADRAAALADQSNMQLSCLQLGFYLASWGMVRGSTVLLQRSLRYLAPVVDVIANAPGVVWESDADNYSGEVCTSLLDIGREIRRAFPEGASDTLVTKIMLGVFGCVPAFDGNFKRGFGASAFGRGALVRIGRFYQENSRVIERNRVPTLGFETASATSRTYSRAKVIDMIFFVQGASRLRYSA